MLGRGPAVTAIALHRHLLSVSETFLSIQGEGPSRGERAVFLRLSGCNLACVWCDTPYTWDWTRHDRASETRTISPDEASAELASLAGPYTRLLVVTGGEPLLQQVGAVRLLDILRESAPHVRCEVETNGTIPPTRALAARVHRFVVSPKLLHSGLRQPLRLRHATLSAFAAHPESVLKIVATGPADLPEAADIAQAGGFTPERVWIMPLGTDAETCLAAARALAAPVIDAGFNLTNRDHVLLWGDQRGR